MKPGKEAVFVKEAELCLNMCIEWIRAFRVEQSLRFVSRFQPRPPNLFTGFLHAVASSRPRRPRRPRRLLRDVVS